MPEMLSETQAPTQEPDDGNKTVEEDIDERLAGSDEEAEQDERIRKCEQDLTRHRARSAEWYDNITKRRMFALARLRKLKDAHTKRMKFYREMQTVVDETDGDSRQALNAKGAVD